MKDILLVGASVEALELAEQHNYKVKAVVDPNMKVGSWRGVVSFSNDLEAIKSVEFDTALLAIDSPLAREKAFSLYTRASISCLSLIAGKVSSSARIGDALFLQESANISSNCVIGNGVRINIGAKVMHDVHIGNFCSVAPNAVLLGGVCIGALSYIGANATVLPGVKIGSQSMVGAGAVVTRDVSEGKVVKGVPAK